MKQIMDMPERTADGAMLITVRKNVASQPSRSLDCSIPLAPRDERPRIATRHSTPPTPSIPT
ncbi:MAG: hypothetical protein AAB242_07750 [Nitrospirota bacterium]